MRPRCSAFPRLATLVLVALGPLCACATPQATGVATLKVPTAGVFELVLGTHHGPNLVVLTPDGRWMVLVESGVLNGLMTEQAFLATTGLKIDTASLHGVTFAEGIEIVEQVFTVPGIYQFMLSDGMEIDPAKVISATIKVAYDQADSQ